MEKRRLFTQAKETMKQRDEKEDLREILKRIGQDLKVQLLEVHEATKMTRKWRRLNLKDLL